LKRLILSTEDDFKTANRLKQYFNLRGDCPFELNKYYDLTNETALNLSNITSKAANQDQSNSDVNNFYNESLNNNQTYIMSSKYCPSTADYLLCFPSTSVNSTIYLKCPYKNGIHVKNKNGKSNIFY
jgi:hypothetical protein